MRITYDCEPQPSIIKDYSKMSDAQLQASVSYGWPGALAEAQRRGWLIKSKAAPQDDLSTPSTHGR